MGLNEWFDAAMAVRLFKCCGIGSHTLEPGPHNVDLIIRRPLWVASGTSTAGAVRPWFRSRARAPLLSPAPPGPERPKPR